MKLADIARLRLCNQRLSRSTFTTPAQVVRWFGAMQSQDLAASLCAVGLRMRNATEALVERALADRSIVRSWPMRRTIHCMAAEDARWMIRLLAPRGIARMKPYHRALKITGDDLARAGKILESAFARDIQRTRSDLYKHLNDAGVATQLPGIPMRGLHFLVHWAQAGLICMAECRGKQPTFALLEQWTPRGRDLSGDEALAELALIYFRAHAPATVRDFAWWSSLPMPEAKRALQLAGDLLKSAEVDGIEYWLLRNTPAAPAGAPPVLLLPAFDEYTVAYADRSMAGDPSVLQSIGHGLSANIVINGRIAGTWRRKRVGSSAIAIAPTFLRILNTREKAGLARATERYAAFLGKALARDEPGKRRPRTPMHKEKQKS